MRTMRYSLLMILWGFSIQINAQQDKPGDTSLVSSNAVLQKLMQAADGNNKYRVEDYFSHPKYNNIQLSPNGIMLAFKEKNNNGNSQIKVREIATGKESVVMDEKDRLVVLFFWATDNRLLYLMDNYGDENYHLYGVNIDGSNNVDLTPYQGVQTNILKRLPDNPDEIIVTMNKDNRQVFEPYNLNIKTGKAVKLYQNTDLLNPINYYDFDNTGALRGFGRIHEGIDTKYFYKSAVDTGYKSFRVIPMNEKFKILSFNYATPNPDDAYLLTNMDSDKARIVLYDFKQKKILKEIYSNPEYDLSAIRLSAKRNSEVDYVTYIGEKYTIYPVSKHFKSIYKKLMKKFKGYQVEIQNQTENEDILLLKVSSDRLYSKIYLYDTRLNRATLLFNLKPELNEKDMAVMKPIKFQSRDGLTIHGYITVPNGVKKGEKFPLIVIPHGVPHSIRDVWGFNSEAQLLAAYGYGTLFVNFRISDGYGKQFYEAGFHQIGRKIMNDIEDGVHYVIQKEGVDSGRIGIYGASHGGYATLMGLIQSPELYKVGVDYVGVSSVFTFINGLQVYNAPILTWVKQLWYNIDDSTEAAIARSVSPTYLIDKINAPLFVAQGANDPRVNISESDEIVAALRKKGYDVPYMVKYDEGHGFLREKNQLDFYKAMIGFIKQHL